MHDWHEVICWILILATSQSEMPWEVIRSIRSWTLVNETSLNHQHQSIKKLVNLCVRLMNCHEDSFLLLCCQLFKIPHNDEGSEGVETWGGFVKDKDKRVTDQLKGNWGSFFLPSWNSFDHLTSDNSVKTSFQFHLSDQSGYFILLLLLAEVEFQIGSKFKSFPDGESFHEDVLLHYIVGEIPKAIVVEWNSIGLDLSAEVLGFYSGS